MSPLSHISLVEQYFAAVDGERLDDILNLLHPDCMFSVETHGVTLRGHDEVTSMFHRLWANHRAVRHHGFHFVDAPATGRISVQFQVENIELDGSITRKSNCNFFDVAELRFSKIAVYMAGPNTLNHETH